MLTAEKSELWSPYKSTITERQRTALQALMYQGKNGATYKDLGSILELHHGQISGVLSNLHGLGLVFVLRNKRKDGCSIYVSHLYRDAFQDTQVIDTPPQNTIKERQKFLEDLLRECLEVRELGNNDYRTEKITTILDLITDRTSASEQEVTEQQTVKPPQRRKKNRKPHPSKGVRSEVVAKRLALIQKTMSDACDAGIKRVTPNDIAVLSGVLLADVYSSLSILNNEGKVYSTPIPDSNKLEWRCVEVVK